MQSRITPNSMVGMIQFREHIEELEDLEVAPSFAPSMVSGLIEQIREEIKPYLNQGSKPKYNRQR